MEVFEFLLAQLGKAFEVMQNFEVFPGLSLFWLFIILIILNVVVTLFVPMLKRSGSGVDRAANSKKGDK